MDNKGVRRSHTCIMHEACVIKTKQNKKCKPRQNLILFQKFVDTALPPYITITLKAIASRCLRTLVIARVSSDSLLAIARHHPHLTLYKSLPLLTK